MLGRDNQISWSEAGSLASLIQCSPEVAELTKLWVLYSAALTSFVTG